MQETKSFDRELFLEICKKYNVPFSEEHKTPMLKLDNGEIVPLGALSLEENYCKEPIEFLYNNKNHYRFSFDTNNGLCIYEV